MPKARRLVANLPAFAPSTAQAVMALLNDQEIALRGTTVAVVGRSPPQLAIIGAGK